MKKIVKQGKKRFFANFFKDGFQLDGVWSPVINLNSYAYTHGGKKFQATVRKWWTLEREGLLEEPRYS